MMPVFFSGSLVISVFINKRFVIYADCLAMKLLVTSMCFFPAEVLLSFLSAQQGGSRPEGLRVRVIACSSTAPHPTVYFLGSWASH